MGVYEGWILPRLLDFAMRNRLLDHYRQRTIETARGLVLEVGVGSGLNLRFYRRAVDRCCGIDLSPELLGLAHERAADAVVPVSLIRASAENIPSSNRRASRPNTLSTSTAGRPRSAPGTARRRPKSRLRDC